MGTRTTKYLDRVHSRFYHFIAQVSKKRKCVVDGYEIEYVRLPWWLLMGGKNSKKWFTGGSCLIHRPSQTTMIFLSGATCTSSKFQFTLYHEYIESCYMLGKPPVGDSEKETRRKTEAAFEEWRKRVPDLEKILTQAIYDHGQSRGHVVALALELDLARREMCEKDFLEHLTNIMNHRL